MSKRFMICAVTLAALCNTLLFAALVPLWQGPDESTHFSYVQYLAENRVMPVYHLPYENYRTDLSEEVVNSRARLTADAVAMHPHTIQPFLYGEEAAPAGGGRTLAADNYHNNALTYGPLYYLYGAAAYTLFYDAPVETRAYAVRFATALLIVPFTYFVYRLGRLILGGAGSGTLLALFTAIMPMAAFVFAIVNNDAMLITCAAGSFYFMLAWWRGGGWRDALAAGLCAGLAAAAKSHGIFMFAALAAVAAARLARARHDWRGAITAFAMAGAAAAPWLAFSYAHYGSFFGPTPPPAQGTATGIISILTPLFFRWPFPVFVSFFGNFGYLDTPMPISLSHTLWYAHIGVLGLIAAAQIRLFQHKSIERGMLFLLLILLITGFDLMLALFFHQGMMEGGQGRYYFIVWPLMAAAIFYSFKPLFSTRAARWCAIILAALMPLFSAYALFHLVLQRYYL